MVMIYLLGRDENVRPDGSRRSTPNVDQKNVSGRRRQVENVSGQRRPVGKAQSGRRRHVENISGRLLVVDRRWSTFQA